MPKTLPSQEPEAQDEFRENFKRQAQEILRYRYKRHRKDPKEPRHLVDSVINSLFQYESADGRPSRFNLLCSFLQKRSQATDPKEFSLCDEEFAEEFGLNSEVRDLLELTFRDTLEKTTKAQDLIQADMALLELHGAAESSDEFRENFKRQAQEVLRQSYKGYGKDPKKPHRLADSVINSLFQYESVDGKPSRFDLLCSFLKESYQAKDPEEFSLSDEKFAKEFGLNPEARDLLELAFFDTLKKTDKAKDPIQDDMTLLDSHGAVSQSASSSASTTASEAAKKAPGITPQPKGDAAQVKKQRDGKNR